MKQLLAITLALVLVLSLGAAAFADGSPTKDVTTDDLPAESVAVKEATVEIPDESDAVKEASVLSGKAVIVPIKSMTAAQKTETNKAIEAVLKEGDMPIDAFAVDTDEAATVAIKLDKTVVVYVFYPDGKVIKYYASELVLREDGTYEIPVEGYSYIIIAEEG